MNVFEMDTEVLVMKYLLTVLGHSAFSWSCFFWGFCSFDFFVSFCFLFLK